MFPEIAKELFKYARICEKEFKDMQDMEFTFEFNRKGEIKLWILQTRNAKRQGAAAFKVAHDLVMEGRITKEQAIMRITPDNILGLLLPQIDSKLRPKLKAAGKGKGAVSGAGSGVIAFSSEEVLKILKDNPHERVVLVRKFTSTSDYEGMRAAGRSGGAVMTREGGPASHAGLVAASDGIPTVVGMGSALVIDEANGVAIIGGKTVKRGDRITVDGATGLVYIESEQDPALQEKMRSQKHLTAPEITKEAAEVLRWADKIRRLKVYANADTPKQARKALKFGAEGIGLVRTEHTLTEKACIAYTQTLMMNLAITLYLYI